MNCFSWNFSIVLFEKVMNEFKYWFIFLDRINEFGVILSQLIKEDVSFIVVYCDVLDIGFGGYLIMGLDFE